VSISVMPVSQSRAYEISELLVGELYFLWRTETAMTGMVTVQFGSFSDLRRCQ
jgi:hypothetical protein